MRRGAGSVGLAGLGLIVLGVGCGRVGDSGESIGDRAFRHLAVLADDSLAGRRTGTPGARTAAAYVARELAAVGVEPAGDSAFFQNVPFLRDTTGRIRLAESWEAYEALPPDQRFVDVNVVGVLPGADPDGGEAVIVGAHHDHVGIGRPVDGDSIYNGADDDASGVVAVLEVARALAASDPPARTVVFLVTTGEEQGLLGTRWYAAHPTIPLARTVADLQIEMIGRPDTAVGGSGVTWLTGYDRSTMGEAFAEAGLPVRPDPRTDQGFFRRSDNFVFARLGIPAHTLSSYTMHADYHRPSDEIERIDRAHLTAAIETAVEAARILANGDAPQWREGGRPEPR